jgi:DNA-binding PadR family transcriptional regulator
MHSRRYSRHADPRRREEFARSRHSGRRGRGGPRAGRGDVRAAILGLIAEEPMHGYEMIKEIEERTGGVWSPSAGSIYPTLQMLEDEGLIRGEEQDGRRRFMLTDAGRAEQESRAGKPPWEEVRGAAAPELLHLRDSIKKLHHTFGQVMHAGDEDQQRRVRDLLDETRRKIYAILAEAE